MNKLCVFAGTTEGRTLLEFLAGQPLAVTACVATDYGQELLPLADNLTVSARRLDQPALEALLRAEGFSLVVDATHPYAVRASQTIAAACAATDTPCLRLLRDTGTGAEEAVFVADAQAAADYLRGTQGTILLTTGSKDLPTFAQLPDFARRVYARVLPMTDSLTACQQAGLPPAHILAMQGPFSQALNLALLRDTGARYLVTKDGGPSGGFAEKAAAAREAGATLVVLGRPPQGEGCSLGEVLDRLAQQFSLSFRPQVTVAGIGPGGRGTMTDELLRAAAEADCLLGAQRMLDAVARPGQETVTAIDPQTIAGHIARCRTARRFVVLLSGDVGFFSGARKLLPLLSFCAVRVLPGVSSLACLCARLGTSYEDVYPVSLHGRDHDIVPDVRAHPRVFALVGGPQGIQHLCAALVRAGLGQISMHVGERLTAPDERLTSGTPASLAEGTYDPLSVALLENPCPDRVITPGLPDEAFRRGRVPMTKSEVRAVCLSKLRLTRTAVCWDVGAGTGSVSVELARLADRGQVFAVERDPQALALLETNRAAFSLDNLTIVPGHAPEALAALPPPTHVFVGGSGGQMSAILAAARAKNPAVRIVAAAVTLESLAVLTDCLHAPETPSGEVVSLTVARGSAAGPYHLLRGQNPVYLFTFPPQEEPPWKP